MKTGSFSFALSALPALLAAQYPALAQQAPEKPAKPDDTIVVTGRTEAEEAAMKEKARNYVRGIEAAPVDGQVARWSTPICPSIHGVDAKVAAIVGERIRKVARDAHAPVAEGECRTNIIVSFTPDAKGLVAALEHKRSQLLVDVTPPERAVLRSSNAPIRWWYTTLTQDADGGPIGSESAALLLQSIDVSTTARNRTSSRYTSSLIKSAVKVNIDCALVLVDVNRATGHKLDAVADYVAFVALSRIRLGRPAPDTPSILALFDKDPGVVELSNWDNAYLAALYKTEADRPASIQRRRVAGQMVKHIVE